MEDVERVRTGAITDPTAGQVVALASVFGVEPSYLLDRGEPVFDGELVEALRDVAVREAAREISQLSERERWLVPRGCDSAPYWPIVVIQACNFMEPEVLPRKRPW